MLTTELSIMVDTLQELSASTQSHVQSSYASRIPHCIRPSEPRVELRLRVRSVPLPSHCDLRSLPLDYELQANLATAQSLTTSIEPSRRCIMGVEDFDQSQGQVPRSCGYSGTEMGWGILGGLEGSIGSQEVVMHQVMSRDRAPSFDQEAAEIDLVYMS
ncbi:hypothetical protein Dimus_009280 [Dionaea muscipula]